MTYKPAKSHPWKTPRDIKIRDKHMGNLMTRAEDWTRRGYYIARSGKAVNNYQEVFHWIVLKKKGDDSTARTP